VGLFDFLRRDRPDDLGRAVTRRLAERGLSGRYDADRFTVSVEGGADLYLGNLYGFWAPASRAQRLKEIDRLIVTLTEEDEDHSWEASSSLLRPMIRPLIVSGPLSDEPAALPARPFVGDLQVYLGVDRPDRTLYVDQTLLKAWGRSFDEAYEVALENLRNGEGYSFAPIARGVWVSGGSDWNEPALLLLPEFIRELDLAGDPVAVPVSRQYLIVAGSEDEDALGAMAGFVAEALADEPQPFPAEPIVFKDGAWRPYEPEGA